EDTTGPPHPPTTYYTKSWYPSDLYFASVSCIFSPPCDYYWDCDGDEAYGEENEDAGSYDNYSEVFVGRVLAMNDPNEAQRWVTKVLNYEQNPGNAASITVVNFVVDGNSPELLAAYQETRTHYPQPPFVINPLISQTAAQVRDALNNQACGWVNLYTHGAPAYFQTRANPPDPAYYFYSTYTPFFVDLTELTNQTKYFLVYSVGCLMAAYDEDSAVLEYNGIPVPIPDTCVAEGFVEAYLAKGAVAFWGNTRWEIMASSAIKHQALLDFMLNNPFGPPNRYLLGVADAYSRTAPGVSEDVARRHNLFGSPLTDAWSDVPKGTRTTALPGSIVKDVPTDITVTVRHWTGSSWAYLSGATVTLYGCGVYLIGSTGANGQYTFEDVEATSTGYVYATATKHNYRFSQATITVTEDKGGLASEDAGLPQDLFMDMTSGNPTKGELKLMLGIPLKDEGLVSLKIYDVSGRTVKMVFSEEKEAGLYEITIPVSQLSAGTYFLRLETPKRVLTEKVIIKR
ncbi:MAG: C25 family cysteine peptidase, partial [candidate division WOR-3 bacterium]